MMLSVRQPWSGDVLLFELFHRTTQIDFGSETLREWCKSMTYAAGRAMNEGENLLTFQLSKLLNAAEMGFIEGLMHFAGY